MVTAGRLQSAINQLGEELGVVADMTHMLDGIAAAMRDFDHDQLRKLDEVAGDQLMYWLLAVQARETLVK